MKLTAALVLTVTLFLTALLAAGGLNPALATYSVPISSFAEGAGEASAGQYEIAFTVGQASPIGAGTSGTFALVSGIVPATMDIAPPEIVHEPAVLAAAGSAVTVEADIEDMGTGVDSVTLYYHEGGLTSFKTLTMEAASGSTYEGIIPASAVTERGVVYYIEATDKRGNVSTVPAGAPDSVQNLPVYFAALASDMNLPSRQYRMVSLPGTPTDGSPDSVLVDDYGRYDLKAWRLGRWNQADACTTGCYDEYPDIADFAPGRAFWLTMDSPRMFDFSGISTDASRPALVHLERGWNQIGTPYAFGTRWASGWVEINGQNYAIGVEHVVGADTVMVENNLIAYDGSYQSFQTHLGAWSGYWVFNASTRAVDLGFPPVIEDAALMQAQPAPAGAEALISLDISWKRPDESESRCVCYAGLARQASDAWDAADLHAPPLPREGLAAFFRQPGWGRLSGRYMTDIRRLSGEGSVWTVTVEAPADIYASLEMTLLGSLPQGWEVALYDRTRGVRITPADGPYALKVPGRAEVEVAAGTPEFLAGEETESGMALRTQLLSLMPNPFADKVTVSFYLSSRERVAIDVFDIRGSLVAGLADGMLGAGVHSTTWDGKTSSGDAAAPGVYFVRMVTDDTARTGKVVKLK